MLEAVYDLIPSELLKQNRRFNYADIKKGLRFERVEDSFLWLNGAGVAICTYNATEPRIALRQNMKSIGIACFRAGSGYYCITSESGRFTDTDQTKSSLTGAVTQLMETKTDYLTDLTLVGELL